MSAARQAILTALRNDCVAARRQGAPYRLLQGGTDTSQQHDTGEENDPRLHELTARAHELIAVLRRGVLATELRATVAGYVRAAREIGVKGERLHDVLELLVHDHARVTHGPVSSDFLHHVLRLADPGFRVGSCAHGRRASTVPHWCRLYRRTA